MVHTCLRMAVPEDPNLHAFVMDAYTINFLKIVPLDGLRPTLALTEVPVSDMQGRAVRVKSLLDVKGPVRVRRVPDAIETVASSGPTVNLEGEVRPPRSNLADNKRPWR